MACRMDEDEFDGWMGRTKPSQHSKPCTKMEQHLNAEAVCNIMNRGYKAVPYLCCCSFPFQHICRRYFRISIDDKHWLCHKFLWSQWQL